ncbi:hypothetical protein AYL99_11931 [Fonsecaea erecta]|uniref:RING-type domain-containing protein n=1 Tax=Fonsecaea erecta TaxID=1367422 RepID=A0A178Z289_9EURO|nr:hypothetical protein AYL99_11931 [Fonsecaea erecta]OAP53909.1 hypothetical protein AYL99_11931 [Fonsecaea erecta]
MPETRSTFEPSQLLDGCEPSLADEYNKMMDITEQTKDRYGTLWRDSNALMANLVRTKAELDRVTALRQQELAEHRGAIEPYRRVIRAKDRQLQKFRRKKQKLRHRIRHLETDLRVANEELEKVAFLICEICYAKIKDTYTTCGHTYCQGCLSTYRQFLACDMTILATQCHFGPCPKCRTLLKPDDIRKLYLSTSQDVVVVDSDSDSPSEDDNNDHSDKDSEDSEYDDN